MADLPATFLAGFHDESLVARMPYSPLGDTDLQVSLISLGTAPFSTIYGDFSVEQCKEMVEQALKSGINYIDTAPWYGQGVSETVLGECLKGIPRKTYYVATKVARYEKDPKLMFDFTAKKTKESVEASLKRLGLDYVDIIQVHDVDFAPSLDIVFNETLPTLQKFVDAGKARFIGITGYQLSILKECLEKSPMKIYSVLNYARMTLIDQTLKEYIPFFKSKNLGIINAAVYAMGLLTNGGPQSWHIASEEIKSICKEASDYCKKNNIELAKLALFYSLQQEGPHTHLVGINTKELLHSNLEVVHNGINKKERETLDYLKEKLVDLFDRVFPKIKHCHWEGVEKENFAEIWK